MTSEEKYNQALERASKLRVQNPFDTVGQMVEHIFPELREDDDEKVRKEIIRVFKGEISFTSEKENEKYIAWLEKQGKRDARYKYLEELLDADTIYQTAINDAMVEEAKTKAMEAISNMNIFELLGFEKQAEQSTDKIASNPDWSEEDDEMLTWLCRIIHTQRLDRAITFKEESELGEWIDKWLNHDPQTKQSEQSTDKIEPKFKVGNWFVNNKRKDVFLIKSINANGYCTLEDIKGNIISPCLPPCESDSHIWTIKDAKDGDVLVDEDGNIGIYSEEKDDVYWHSCIYLGCDDCLRGFSIGGYHKRKNTEPATKEQRELLFSKMRKAGYEWGADEKKLKNIEPKFKVGDWVVGDEGTFKITRYEDERGYELTGTTGYVAHFISPDYVESNYHLWTIQDDAKDGDVLATENFIFIFKNIDSENGVHYHCQYEISKHQDDEQFDVALPQSLMGRVGNGISHYFPATKEQRELLFEKMKQAGYEWRQEEKKLIRTKEPKFKVGDWIVTDDSFGKIVRHVDEISSNIIDERYVVSDEYGLTYNISFGKEHKWHKWTIDDAKNGDVLVDLYSKDSFIILYKGIDKERNILAHCGWNGYYLFVTSNDGLGCGGLDNTDYLPATKEQRELLFEKMKQADYEWDAENKKLSKQTLQITPKFCVGQVITDDNGNWYKITNIKCLDDWYYELYDVCEDTTHLELCSIIDEKCRANSFIHEIKKMMGD